LYASSSSVQRSVALYRVDDDGEMTEAFIIDCPAGHACYDFGKHVALSRTHLFVSDTGGVWHGGEGIIAVYELKGSEAAGPQPDQLIVGGINTTSRMGEALAVTPDGSWLTATLNEGSTTKCTLVTFSLNTTSGLYEWDNEFTLNSFGDDSEYMSGDGLIDTLVFSDDGKTLVVGDGDRSFARADELDFVQDRKLPVADPSTTLPQVGRVIILRREVSTWAVHSILNPPAVYAYQQFGSSVDICGGTIIVGAPNGTGIGTDTQAPLTGN
jgi:hypothetical protein